MLFFCYNEHTSTSTTIIYQGYLKFKVVKQYAVRCISIYGYGTTGTIMAIHIYGTIYGHIFMAIMDMAICKLVSIYGHIMVWYGHIWYHIVYIHFANNQGRSSIKFCNFHMRR